MHRSRLVDQGTRNKKMHNEDELSCESKHVGRDSKKKRATEENIQAKLVSTAKQPRHDQ